MAKKTKEKSLDTKDKKFNFDEEIIIGLKRIDEKEDKPQKNKKKNRKSKNRKEQKQINTNNNIKLNTHENSKSQQGAVKNKKQVNKKSVEKKLTPKQELARRKRKAIFKLVKWLMLIGIIIGGIIYTLLSPIFNIKTISVEGNSKISIDEIISLSGLQLEQNMFNYKQSDVVENIKQNAYIDTVKVSRKIPDTVEIIVSEREASFMIKFANAYAFINNQGYILEISNKKQNLPIITGIETIQEELQTGNRLCTEDLKKLGDVLKIMEASASNGLSKDITKIDITDSDNYILTLQKKKKIVHLGDTSNLSTKMLWILKFNELEGKTKGEIILNMNLNDDKNKPYFRKEV